MKLPGGHPKITKSGAPSRRLAGRESVPTEREERRAKILHAAFLDIEKRRPSASRAERYRMMKKMVSRSEFSMTARNFRRLSKIWDESKCAEVLIRKKRPGIPRNSPGRIATVVRFAIANRMTFTASVKALRALDPSIPQGGLSIARPAVRALRRLYLLNCRRKRIELEIFEAHAEAMKWVHGVTAAKENHG